MNGLNDVRPGYHQQVVVPLEVVLVVLPALAPEVLLLELVALHHGAHAAVQHDDALLHDVLEDLEHVAGYHCSVGGARGVGGCIRVNARGSVHDKAAEQKGDQVRSRGTEPEECWKSAHAIVNSCDGLTP